MRKYIVLVLVTFLVVSILSVFVVPSVTAQAGFKPSVPQFSVKFIDNSYDVPSSTTTVTDLYTGKETTITNQGYYVEKYDIEVAIKNQPFTAYTNADGYVCDNLYFDIQVKAHFDENWRSSASIYPFYRIEQSGSKETVVTFTLQDGDGLWAKPPSGGQLDFRVEAYTGYLRDPTQAEFVPGFSIGQVFVRVGSSGWSIIQTVTVTYGSSSSSQTDGSPENPTPSGNNHMSSTNFTPLTSFLLGIIVIMLCVIVVLVILFISRQPKTQHQEKV